MVIKHSSSIWKIMDMHISDKRIIVQLITVRIDQVILCIFLENKCVTLYLWQFLGLKASVID